MPFFEKNRKAGFSSRRRWVPRRPGGSGIARPKVESTLRFETSVYAAAEIGGMLYVGGSNWNRRKVPYSKKIAEKSKGVLQILRGRKVVGFREFPSMIYSILELPSKKTFVGCKSAKGTLSIMNRQRKILLQKDDRLGGGVYNAVFNRKRNEITLSTRAGKLEVIDAESLETKAQLQLTKEGTRLWSLKESGDGKLFSGDYDGMLYAVDRNNFREDAVLRFDFKSLHTGSERLKEGFGPSLWGMESIDENRLLVGNRWGDIAVAEPDFARKRFNVKMLRNIGEDISCMQTLSGNTVLVGTRYGKVFSFDLYSSRMEKLIEIPPSKQKENAIWGMAPAKGGALVCFADGNVAKVSM